MTCIRLDGQVAESAKKVLNTPPSTANKVLTSGYSAQNIWHGICIYLYVTNKEVKNG
jgi:hypothetical protein